MKHASTHDAARRDKAVAIHLVRASYSAKKQFWLSK
jgi:hypothetical protein